MKSSKRAIDQLHRVEDRLGGPVDDFYRLFMVPGPLRRWAASLGDRLRYPAGQVVEFDLGLSDENERQVEPAVNRGCQEFCV